MPYGSPPRTTGSLRAILTGSSPGMLPAAPLGKAGGWFDPRRARSVLKRSEYMAASPSSESISITTSSDKSLRRQRHTRLVDEVRGRAARSAARRFLDALRSGRFVVASGGRDVYIATDIPPDQGAGVPVRPSRPDPTLQGTAEADPPQD
jgi:hypothetical protein